MSYPRGDYLYNEKNGVALQPTRAREETTEKTRLQQPVKLQPSWEENNLPEDELNFKNLTMDDASLQLNTPPDRYRLVYLTFLINGIGVLMPWNMFITADAYFMKYKLAKDYVGFAFPFMPQFMQYLTFCSQIPNVSFSWINIFVQLRGSLTTRIVFSIIVQIIIFIVTILLAMSDTSKWPYVFFWITMICVVILNMACGIYQSTIFGMASKLPGKYVGAVVLGNNISGTFCAILSIVTRLLTSNLRTAAIYYFIMALFILLICFDTYFALPLNRYYRHYELREKKEIEQRKQLAKGLSDRPPYMYIIKKAWPQLFNVFFIFFVTLSVFPAVHAGIQANDKDFFIPPSYYGTITCFVTFNVCSMIGSSLTSFFIWPKPQYLWIFVVLRVLYIPFYLLCNYQVEGIKRILPVLITNDWAYWIVATTMGLTNGYFSSLGMMYAPRTVEERYAGTAGMFAASFLVTGIFTGILSTFLWPQVIAHVGN